LAPLGPAGYARLRSPSGNGSELAFCRDLT
jgi:hypothetical protein